MSKYVYYFGGKKAEGRKEMKALLGGKGANLAEMVNIGIPVPPGFTITTEVCAIYQDTKGVLPSEVKTQIDASLKKVEAEMGRQFGNPENPLLFSVRSGAAASMPGMMDTVLNLGLNDATVTKIASEGGARARFAYDSYRRFITMYADVVMQLGREEFEHAIDRMKAAKGVKYDAELSADDLKALCSEFLQIYNKRAHASFPQEPQAQLYAAINAVFRSWGNPRAMTYRRMYHITGLLGTAVNVQGMVFGNLNNKSATGVAFSRNPSTGHNFFYGEYLVNAQGEDVVAGIRTPQQITAEMSKQWAKDHNISEADRTSNYPSMEESMPDNFKHLVEIKNKLELHFRDMQDIEFTVEDGRLWMLQCRNAKRTMLASVKCAVDMVQEGLIDEEEAVMRIDPDQVDHLLHPYIDATAKLTTIAKGLAASPGAACGQAVFNAEDAVAWKAAGKKVIMIRLETSPEDLAGMSSAEGVLTARGGMTSHAAVVARGMGKTCVAGCGDMVIKGKTATIGGKVFKEGDWVSIDGTRGLVFAGKVPLVQPSVRGDFDTILKWCHKFKRLGVRANADTIKDTKTAFEFGAEGVGLTRTEHMFFEGNRIDAMREMILAKDEAGRRIALSKILPLQRGDFSGIFREMKGHPVTIRLLDPPLHEFVPHEPKAQSDLAAKIGMSAEAVARRVKELHEENPMLGHRGVRLGVTYPEIYNMQVQAIIEAAIEVRQSGMNVIPEIMIPLIGKKEELAFMKEHCIKTAEGVLKNSKVKIDYLIGTMIEVPRAAITADEIAEEAQFFSFGTNDLTQMGCGFSRDDSGSFLKKYVEEGIYARDPFQSLDQGGVGELVRIAVKKGRSVNPLLKCGICGEHGGDPTSIDFFHRVGLNYVSCSPYRVPVAIVAAARAAIAEKRAVADARAKLAAKL
jgi:pyruvate,orthophosphate dikinase